MLTTSDEKAEESVIDLTDPRQPDFDDDRYRDWRLIGEGGTARVFRVFDGRLGCDVAIKLLKTRFIGHARVIQGLQQEVLISRRLRHPGIAAIHDFYDGVGGTGVVMDLVEGSSLKDWLHQHRGHREQTLPQRLHFLTLILQALELAHQYVVHRDLKPANIMLTESGDGGFLQPIIMDFGLALPLDKGEMRGREGTLKYIAPEQWLVSSGGRETLSAQADLFSMGVMAYELITGRVPMQSMHFMELSRSAAQSETGHSNRAPSDHHGSDEGQEWAPEWQSMQGYCRGIPASLDHVVHQMLSFKVNERPASAVEVRKVLNGVVFTGDRDAGEAAVAAGISVNDAKGVAELGVLASLRDIPKGSFIMGSGPESQNPQEKPRRRLNMSAFRMSATVVTNEDYRHYLAATGANRPPFIDDAELGAKGLPVVGVSWAEARAFAQWCGGDLPTEAQWEYAARCGEKRVYPWGDEEVSPLRANIGRVTNGPLAVNSTGSNEWGLADMSGNVWEWCLDDWLEILLETFSKGGEDPIGRTQVSHRRKESVERPLRGGAFDTFPVMGRCASRFHAFADSRSPAIGFRIVLPMVDGKGA